MRALTLAVLAAVIGVLTLSGPASAKAAQRPCSTYPTPGSRAPASAAVPAALRTRYAILRRPQAAADRLSAEQINASLPAAGLITSGIRFLGHVAFGGRIYLIPAQHLLGFPIAPARCLPASERSLEHELLPQLRKEYAHTAVCLVIIHGNSGSPSCGAPGSSTESLLYTSGTPGFGLVPDGVSAVTVTYGNAPPRTLTVRHNFFAIVDRAQVLPPCGLQWLDPTGSVTKVVSGCSFVAQELPPLTAYRSYGAGKLATLQSQVVALISAIRSGSLTEAEAAWETARLTWLDIGQDDNAYGAFGQLGLEIDGTAAGLKQGIASPQFTGFHKIELDLWITQDLTAAATDTTRLQSLVAKLVQIPLAGELPGTKTGIGNWVLRPHEILEDANRDTLTGDDDYGSGSQLASMTADLAATREFLNLLAPVINPLAPHLVSRARGELNVLSAAIAASRVDGQYVPLQGLPTIERAAIDADTGAALETLASIPDLITSTGNSAPSS